MVMNIFGVWGKHIQYLDVFCWYVGVNEGNSDVNSEYLNKFTYNKLFCAYVLMCLFSGVHFFCLKIRLHEYFNI